MFSRFRAQIGPIVASVAGVAAVALGGCRHYDEPPYHAIHHPVEAATSSVFVDPVGYRYPEIVQRTRKSSILPLNAPTVDMRSGGLAPLARALAEQPVVRPRAAHGRDVGPATAGAPAPTNASSATTAAPATAPSAAASPAATEPAKPTVEIVPRVQDSDVRPTLEMRRR